MHLGSNWGILSSLFEIVESGLSDQFLSSQFVAHLWTIVAEGKTFSSPRYVVLQDIIFGQIWLGLLLMIRVLFMHSMEYYASQRIFTTSLQQKKNMKMKVKDWNWKKHPKPNTGKQTLKFAQSQNCLPKFFVVLVVRTTAMSPQSQIWGEPETLEPPWQELHVLWTQLLQEDEDAPRDIRFQLNFNGTLNHNEHKP